MRSLTIHPILNGYLVQAGCQQVAFTSREQLISSLRDYLNDPKNTEERFLRNAVNPMSIPLPPSQGCAGEINEPACNTQAPIGGLRQRA